MCVVFDIIQAAEDFTFYIQPWIEAQQIISAFHQTNEELIAIFQLSTEKILILD